MKKYLKSMFYSDGKPQPVYGYIFILLSLIIAMLAMRIFGGGNFSDALILGMCGFVVAWAGIITAGQNRRRP
jgi:amino acid permease